MGRPGELKLEKTQLVLKIEMKDLFTLSIILLITLLNSCGLAPSSENSSKPEFSPNVKLALEFKVDSNQLLYQYYQKFGFTDLCEEIRMISKYESTFDLMKQLPLEANDLLIINSFLNKADSIGGDTLAFQTSNRHLFRDIELEFSEFKKSRVPIIGLKKGSYEIIQTEKSSILRIYNPQSKLFYLEVHRCEEM